MGKQGRYIYKAEATDDVAAVGTTFNAAKKSVLALNTPSVGAPGSRWQGRLEGVIIKVKSIAGGASTITLRGVDSSGAVILPDTVANIAVDIGIATEGTVAYIAGLDWTSPDDELNIFYKTDAGTVVVDYVQCTWSE